MNQGTLKTNIVLLLVLSLSARCFAQDKEVDEKNIKALIQEAYIGGAYNDDDTEAMKKGFHDQLYRSSIARR